MAVEVVEGDCLEVMRSFADASFDLVVTSPPYNLCLKGRNWGGFWKRAALLDGYDGFDDCLPDDEYIGWQRSCLSEMLRLVGETGAVMYNHKWVIRHGLLNDRRAIIEGFPLRQVLVWARAGGYNFNRGYFVPTYEVVYIFAKSGFRLVPKAAGYGDVWKIPQEPGEHPAPFPLLLPKRLIASTYAKRVLDPFCGSGTTLLAAKQLNVDGVGIERSHKYVEMARKRLA